MKAGKEKEVEKSFFENVFEVVRLIPGGRVTSYGAIANFLGTKGSARMVGWAMNASHTQTGNIPAHRVVNRNGVLTGKHHFGTPQLMQKLLENEGIEVVNDQICRFSDHFWDPSREIGLEAVHKTVSKSGNAGKKSSTKKKTT